MGSWPPSSSSGTGTHVGRRWVIGAQHSFLRPCQCSSVTLVAAFVLGIQWEIAKAAMWQCMQFQLLVSKTTSMPY